MVKEDILFRNNTGNKSKRSLIEGFVVRTAEFEMIYENLRATAAANHKQSFLIIGQRGAGKTSLMHRLKYAIEDDPKLNHTTLPVIFSEEQYFLSELVNLWENIAVYLEDHYNWRHLQSEIEEIISQEEDFELKVYQVLRSELTNANKSIVLFIENIAMFYNKLSEAELLRLSDVLINDGVIRLIGTSTTFAYGKIDLTTVKFSYFKVLQLDGLNKEECEQLLIRIAEQYGKVDQIKNVIEKHPGRTEALRRLTGGIPRTISYLFQIFLDNENGKAIKDLYLLVDTLTLLYKSELDQLSTQQQRVIDIIARRWDAIPVKDIVKATRLESKNISKILTWLEREQLIERVNRDSKNHLYRIRERFMNIWYLMRFGRKHDRENVIWLVRFFDTWCEKNELDKLITGHIDNLKEGSYDVNAAIDMANAFFACNASDAKKDELLTATQSMLPERMLNNVKRPSSNQADINVFGQLISDGKYDEALEMADKIEHKNNRYYKLASTLFLLVKDFDKSVAAAKKALELDSNDSYAAITLGIIYEDYIKNVESAIKYYEISLSQKPYHPYAASRLGDIYFYLMHDSEKAINYHTMAIRKSFRPSLLSLGKIYLHENKLKDAEHVLLEAKRHSIKGVNVELGQLYARLDQPKKAKEYFETAVRNNEEGALIDIGSFYQYKRKPEYGKAEFYYNEAIKNGVTDGYGQLGKLYHRRLNQKDKAFDTYTAGVEHGDVLSTHQLAHLYAERKEYDKANELFLKAIDLGDEVAALCMAGIIYGRGQKDKKKLALEVIEVNLPKLKNDFPADIFYAKMLLWNNELERSVQVIKGAYKEIIEIKTNAERFEDDDNADNLLSELVSYFSLLLAKKEYKAALQLFTDKDAELKSLLKPMYFVLMDSMKNEYPLEYLRAGEEFTDTIEELKKNINRIKKRV